MQHLAAISMLMGWTVRGSELPFNQASPVRCSKYAVKKDKTRTHAR